MAERYGNEIENGQGRRERYDGEQVTVQTRENPMLKLQETPNPRETGGEREREREKRKERERE